MAQMAQTARAAGDIGPWENSGGPREDGGGTPASYPILTKTLDLRSV
jgi:hypothetical protein